MNKNAYGLVAIVFVFALASCTRKSAENAAANNQAALTPVEKGKSLVAAKGCVACHSVDGTRMVGPSYKGIYGTEVKVIADGKTITVKVDDAYIRESIEAPQSKLVEGYPPSMPAYKGLVSDEEIVAITEYIKSLK